MKKDMLVAAKNLNPDAEVKAVTEDGKKVIRVVHPGGEVWICDADTGRLIRSE